MSGETLTASIERQAAGLGFGLCGVVRAEGFPELAQMQEWLERGYAGEMRYLNDPRRGDPRRAMEGIRSVIVCALNYNTDRARSIDVSANSDAGEPRGWISRYAWGRDYHEVVRERLEVLREALHREIDEPFESRVYVDTGPVSERALAQRAGLGWIGKNTLLLNQQVGSYFFLGVILTTLDLPASIGAGELPPPDLCGSCRRCLDACPTQAFVEPYVMDARRCISYLTIELRGAIPEEFREAVGAHVFGCDICQDVCPWNRRAPETELTDFQPRALPGRVGSVEVSGVEPERETLFHPKLARLAAMTEEEFREAFRGSPIKRTKWRGLVRNACIALGNAGAAKMEPAVRGEITLVLERLKDSTDSAIGESAQWALSRIQASE